MASKKLVRLAVAAAKANAKAHAATRAWVNAFREEYGHDNISDALVEVIDYASGDTNYITAEFIEENSSPGMS